MKVNTTKNGSLTVSIFITTIITTCIILSQVTTHVSCSNLSTHDSIRGHSGERPNMIVSYEIEPVSSLLLDHFFASIDYDENNNHNRKLQMEKNIYKNELYDALFTTKYNHGIYSSLIEINVDDALEAFQKSLDGENRRRLLLDDQDTIQSLTEYIQHHNDMVKKFNQERHFSRYELEYQKRRKESTASKGLHYERNIVNDKRKKSTLRNLANERMPSFKRRSKYYSEELDFDNIQTIPLSQGYGTHFATVWVGSPTPQRKTLIVDTGSHHTAFPCKECVSCGEINHTDKYFDQDASETFEKLTCKECVFGATCKNIDYTFSPDMYFTDESKTMSASTTEQNVQASKMCIFSQSYTEGSSWEAYQARDKFYCGGRDILSAANPIDQHFAIDFTFGCQTSTTGLFVSQLADGIMGLSQHDATLPRALFESKKIQHPVFTLCFRRETVVSKTGIIAGSMTLGGVDPILESTPIVWARNVVRTGWFTVYVKNVFLRLGGGQSAKSDLPDQEIIKITTDMMSINSGKGVIVDSGTTDTYLHVSLLEPFNNAWKSITGTDYENAPIKLSKDELLHLPTILIQLLGYEKQGIFNGVGYVGSTLDPKAPNDILLAIPATHYMEYSPSRDSYTSRVYFTETRGGVIGANSLQGHNVVFDWGNGRVGFGESTCRVSPHSNENDLFLQEVDHNQKNCILTKPSIVSSCSDSIDTSLCTESNPNQILTGKETFSVIIEHPALQSGLGCVEVLSAQYDLNEINSSIQCEGNGLCTVEKTCSLRCDEIEAIHPVSPIDLVKPGQDAELAQYQLCGKNQWSSCLDTCYQSKTVSVLMSDGLCYEDIMFRESRPCHTDYCGRLDPCRVPFVVHTILALRDVDATLWEDISEAVIIDCFVAAVSANIQDGDEPLFHSGDVKVLITSPWYEADSDEPALFGTKIVMEISVYDPHQSFDNAVKSKVGFRKKVSSILRRRNDYSDLVNCGDLNVYDLAKKAHNIQNILESKNFMSDFMTSFDEILSKPFLRPTETFKGINKQMFQEQSAILTSWTIKTDLSGGELYENKLDPYAKSNIFTDHIKFWILVLIVIVIVTYKTRCGEDDNSRLDLSFQAALDQLRHCNKSKGEKWYSSSRNNIRQRRKIAEYERIKTNSDHLDFSDDDDRAVSQIKKGDQTKYRMKVNSIISN